MDPFYTITGPRPDLAAMEFNPPEGYIGQLLMPWMDVSDKSGTIYYNTVTADETAQTGRSAGTAPTGTQISTSNTTYTCAEIIDRGKITPDEAKQMGGIEKADMVGAKFAKRNVCNYVEGAIRDVVLDSGVAASASFDPPKVLTQIQDALDSVRLYEGKTTLVAATKTLRGMWQALLAESGPSKALARIVNGTTQNLNFKAWLEAMSMYFGVDQVLAGDDTIWNATAVSGRFAIGKFDAGTDPMSHKWRPIYGKVWRYLPESGTEWYVESVADRLTKNNMYDATIWANVVELNAAAKYVFDGVA